MDGIAAELVGAIEAAGLTRAVLVGHSQGGTVPPLMLRRRRDLFRQAIYLTACAPKPGWTSKLGKTPDEAAYPLDPKVVDPCEQFALMFCSDMDETETSAFLARLGKDMLPMNSCSAQELELRRTVADAQHPCDLFARQQPHGPVARDLRKAPQSRSAGIHRLRHQAMNTRPHGLAEILRHLGRATTRP